jgi:integrase
MHQDRRSGNWLYKRQLPTGKTFVRSFGTTDLKTAETKWSEFDIEYNDLAGGERTRARYRNDNQARRAKFLGSVARFLIAEKAKNGGKLREFTRHLVEESAFDDSMMTATNQVRTRFFEWAEQHDPDALTVFEMRDMRHLEFFHQGVAAAYMVMMELEKLQGPTAVAIATPAIPDSVPDAPEDGHTWEVMFQRWVRETKPAETSQADVKRAIKMFEEANAEDLPRVIEQVTRAHVSKMRAKLSETNLSNDTRNKRLAGMSILCGQALREFMIDSNPFLGTKFDIKDGERTKRESFTKDEYKRWLSIPTFTRHKFGPYGASEFWIPLLCIAHGMRRGEAAQLFTTDIIREDGHWCLNIDGVVGSISGITPTHGIVRKIKNTGSRRRIPIHPMLTKAGFLDWVKSLPPGRLFPQCPQEADGSFGCVSKFTRLQLDEARLDPGLSIHCARHTYRTYSREAEIVEEVTDSIVGHAGNGQGRKYGKVPIRTKAKAMARVQIGAAPKLYRES